jgi:hypothetical protein
MAVTRIKNNQITDLTVNAAAKLVDFSVTSDKIANDLTYGSNLTIEGNLTVNGNTTTIDTYNLVVEDPLILLAKEQTGAPALDIGFIGKRGTEDNIAWIWDESNDEFAAVFTTSEVTNTVVSINSYASAQFLDVTMANATINGNITFNGNIVGNISLTGNVTAGNLNSNNAVIAAGNINGNNVNATNAITAGTTITATGNVSGSNVNTAGQVTATGNVSGGNITTGGQIVATSDITGGNLITLGNVDGNSINATNSISAGTTISATGNVSGGNFTTVGNVVATGNVSGEYLIANTAIIGNVVITDLNVGNITANGFANITGNVTGGNLITGGLVSATGNVSGGNVNTAGQVTATGNITGGNVTTAGNVSANNLSTTNEITAGTTITATGNVSGGNVNTAGQVTATGNITGGNLITAGNVSANNLSTTNEITAGTTITATGNVSGGNVNTAGQVVATGNVSGGNITTIGVVQATGNVISPVIVTTTVTTSSGDLTLNSAGGNLQWDGAGNIVMNSQWINNLADPVVSQDAATKQYVDDAVSSGIHIHAPVDVETPVALPAATYNQGGNTATVTDTVAGNTVVFSTAVSPQVNDQLWFTNSFNGVVANIAYFVVSAPNTSAAVLSTQFNGAPVSNISNATGLTQAVRINSGIGANLVANVNAALTVDGFSVSPGNRVLVYNQSTAYENGIYDVTQVGNVSAPWILTRSSDAETYIPDSSIGLDEGTYVYVKYGDTGAGESYVLTAPTGPFNIGQAAITFTQFSASQVYTANTAAGLVLNGTVFSAKVDNNTTAFDGGGNIIVKASANLTTPNIGAATGTSLDVTGNVSGGNVTTIGNVVATGNVSGGNLITTGNVNGNGAVFSGNVTAANFIGNISGNIDAGGANTEVQFNDDDVLNGSAGFTFNKVGNVLTVTGNISGANLVTGGIVDAVGNIATANYFLGNGAFLTNLAEGSNTEIQFNNDGNLSGDSRFTFNAAGNGTLSVNYGGGGNIQTDDIFANVAIFSFGTITADANIITQADFEGVNLALSGNAVANGNITAGNINSLALVSAVTVDASGNISGNNLSITNNANSTNFTATGTVTTPNVTSASGLSITTASNGNITLDPNGTGVIILEDETANRMLFTGANKEIETNANATFDGSNLVITGSLQVDNVIVNGSDITSNTTELSINAAGDDIDFRVSGNTNPNVLFVDAGSDSVIVGSNTATTGATFKVDAVDSILLPVGNTAERPDPASVGMLRFNNTLDELEFYGLGGWQQPGSEFTVITDDQFTGNGVQVNFTLTSNSTTAATIVSINGVVQIPTTSYSVTGNVLTFTEAPESTDVIDARVLTTTTTITGIQNSSGNAGVSTSETSDTIFIEGDLIPTSNVTYDLGNSTNYWNNLFLSGNTIYLGPLQLKAVNNTTFGVFQSDGTTEADIDVGNIDVSSLNSGNSVIGIAGTNGNAFVTIGGTSNVAVFSTAGANITGRLGVSGNITGSYIFGNGSQLTGIDATQIQNGTSNVKVPSSGSNVTISVAGTPNVAVITATGANIAGTLNATGNANVGNIGATNAVFSAMTINGNAIITGNLRVDGTETIFNTQTLTVNDLDIIVANNVSGGANINGAGIQAGNPATATWFYNNATTSWQSNVGVTPTANGTLSLGGASNYWGSAFVTTISATGNANVGNVGATNAVFTNIAGTLTTASQTNITSVGTLGSLSVTGNISGSNLNITGGIFDTGALDLTSGSNGNITLSPNGTGVIVANKDIRNGQGNGVGNIGASGASFNTIFAKSTSAQYADLAEKYVADVAIEPGTVVCFGGSQEVTTCDVDACRKIAGVVSTNPSYIMNAGLEGETVITVALTGRVPVKVVGPVRKGDMMVSAGNGRARAEADPKLGTVIGKSLEDFDGTEGVIEVVVGRL